MILIVIISFMVSCSYSMENLPQGELLNSFDSPNGTYTVNIYLCNGGATVDYAVRGELKNNIDGSQHNIYWNYHEDHAEVEWIDDETVIINGIQLNVLTEIYDFRNH